MKPNVERQIPQNAVRTFHDSKGKRRLVIFRRSDGTFGFDEWFFLDEENSWALCRKESEAVLDTLDRAIQEATDRVGWMKD